MSRRAAPLLANKLWSDSEMQALNAVCCRKADRVCCTAGLMDLASEEQLETGEWTPPEGLDLEKAKARVIWRSGIGCRSRSRRRNQRPRTSCELLN